MFTKKLITSISVIASLLACAAGFWLFDGHYETKAASTEKITKVEFHVAGAIQKQQIQNDYKFYQFMYDKLTRDIANYRRALTQTPNDQFLREDYKMALKQRAEIKLKLDELMRKIN